jgi:thiamine pyrophosphate-dependent acetolactate synthase large subunit-like protein
MNVADYVVASLWAQGIRHIFGYPGSPLVPLLAAIERHPGMQWVLMRHENSGALAASASARATGGLGVCVATSGPGALNFVCGVVDAHSDRVPLLAITGLVPTASQGHWEFQDVDQTRLFGSILDRSAACIHPSQSAALLRNFIGHAQQHNEAVHLGFPSDILSFEIDDADETFRLDPDKVPTALRLMPPPTESLQIVAKDFDRYGEIVIVAGRRALGCGPDLEALAEKLQAPIITTLDGKGVVDESHPHSAGVLGIFGFPAVEATKRALQRADAVLAFGVDTLKPFLTDDADVQRRVLIQCEPEFASLTQEYHRARTLMGPLDEIARGLLEHVSERPSTGRYETAPGGHDDLEQQLEAASERPTDHANPVTFFSRLNAYLDERTTVVLDTGMHTLWAAEFIKLTKRQRVLVSSRLGTMGFSLPAAIAAQLARPDDRIVAVCGDGGLEMVVGELATAVQYGLPITLVVFDNGVLQNVSAQQADPYGTELHNPDFVALARAYGADGARVEAGTDLDEVLRRAFDEPRDVPFLIDLHLDPEVTAHLSKWESATAPVPSW